MKRMIALILCVWLTICSSAFAESLDLGSMSFDELTALKESIEEEMKTRNVKKMDFHTLTVDELQEVIVQALLEMCSREEWVNELSPSGSGMFRNVFGAGISLIFRDAKENYYSLWLRQDDVELNYSNASELILEQVQGIKIGQ